MPEFLSHPPGAAASGVPLCCLLLAACCMLPDKRWTTKTTKSYFPRPRMGCPVQTPSTKDSLLRTAHKQQLSRAHRRTAHTQSGTGKMTNFIKPFVSTFLGSGWVVLARRSIHLLRAWAKTHSHTGSVCCGRTNEDIMGVYFPLLPFFLPFPSCYGAITVRVQFFPPFKA